jgi:hypothetical protein
VKAAIPSPRAALSAAPERRERLHRLNERHRALQCSRISMFESARSDDGSGRKASNGAGYSGYVCTRCGNPPERL